MGEGLVVTLSLVLALAVTLVVFLAPVFAILGIVWICRGGRYRCDRARQAQEAQLMQQIHQGLAKLDTRVEALETILLDVRAPDFAEREP